MQWNQVLDLDTHQKLRRFVMRHVLGRQLTSKYAPYGAFIYFYPTI